MSNYFRRLPDLEYVSRLKDSKISDYLVVKNLFKKGILRDDIYQNIATFDKYKIIGDERPDNVAKKIYDNSELDWLVLVSNNIINININVDDNVFHERFGKGKVVEIEFDGNNSRATINFQNSGHKKVLLRFAKLKILK